MVEKSKEKRANEQAKAQNLFARWRKEETLYSEDEKKKEKTRKTTKRERIVYTKDYQLTTSW